MCSQILKENDYNRLVMEEVIKKDILSPSFLSRHTSQLQQDVSFVPSKSNSVSLLGVQLCPLLLSDSPRLLRAQPRQLNCTEHHLSDIKRTNVCFCFFCQLIKLSISVFLNQIIYSTCPFLQLFLITLYVFLFEGIGLLPHC